MCVRVYVCVFGWHTYTHTHRVYLWNAYLCTVAVVCGYCGWLSTLALFVRLILDPGQDQGQASNCNWPEYRGNAPTTHTQTHPPIPAHLGECINYVYLNYKQAVLWQRRDKYTPGHSRYWPLPDQLPAGYGPCDAFVACASQATRTASLARIFTKDLCQKLISWKNVLFLAHSVCRCVWMCVCVNVLSGQAKAACH